jgi:hypothetical protein
MQWMGRCSGLNDQQDTILLQICGDVSILQPFTREGSGVVVSLPAEAPDAVDSVVVLQFGAPLEIEAI